MKLPPPFPWTLCILISLSPGMERGDGVEVGSYDLG